MRSPLVHCLTNAVTAPFVADCVTAVGGRPIMTEDLGECAQLAHVADGLFVNLGQLTTTKQNIIRASVENRGTRPWVLDPVGVGFFPGRLEFARTLLGFRPHCLRGNASEIWALATGQQSGSGTDSTFRNQKTDWAEALKNLSVQEVCLTQGADTPGARDFSLRGGRLSWFSGGQALMGQLAGFGCALSAVAATLGTGAQALDLFSGAGHATQTGDLGAFRSEFLSHLARLARRAQTRQALPLYFVAGPQDCDHLPTVLAAALAGGITCFQYRPKNLPMDQVLSVGRQLRAQCMDAGVPFIANDSIDLAKALAADGVHLGQGDDDAMQARRALGHRAIIGLSVSLGEHWQTFDEGLVDYVGLGPFAATQTKPDARSPLGPKGLQTLRQGFESIPCVAIGGIEIGNAAAAYAADVDGIAVVSAISKASDAKAATQALVLTDSKPKSAV